MNRECYNCYINHFQRVGFLHIHQYINFEKQQTIIFPSLFRAIRTPEEWKPHDDPKKESEKLRELFPEFHDAVVRTPRFQEALKHIDPLNDQLDVTFKDEYLTEKEQNQLKDIAELMSNNAKPLVHSMTGYFLIKKPLNHSYSDTLLTRYLVISTQQPPYIPNGYELCSVDLIPSTSLKIFMGHIPDTTQLIIDRERYGLTASSNNSFKLVNRDTVEKNLTKDTNQIESEIKKNFSIKSFHLSTDLRGFYAGTILKDWFTQFQQVNQNERDGILPQGIVTKTLEGTDIKLTNNPDTTSTPSEYIFFTDYENNAKMIDHFQNNLLKMTHDTVLSRLPNGRPVPKLGASNAFKFTNILENPSSEVTQDQFAQWVLERMYATKSSIRDEMWKTYPETTYFIDENLKHSLRQEPNPMIDVAYDTLRERDIDFTTGIPKRFPEPIPPDSYVNELQEAMGIADTKIATAPRWSFTRFKWKVIKQGFRAVHKVQMLSEAKTNIRAQAIGNIAESCDQLFSTLANGIPVKDPNIMVFLKQAKEIQQLVPNKLIKSLEIENTMSQVAAFAFMKILGFSMQNACSYYSHFVVLNLPRIKRNIPQFSNCLQLADFGEVALQYRIKSPSNRLHSFDWLPEYMLINQQLDESSPPIYLSGDYFLANHYFNWIQDNLYSNSQDLLEKLAIKYTSANENSLSWIRIQLEQQLNNFINVLKSNPHVDITPNFLLTQYPILTDALFESYKNMGVY